MTTFSLTMMLALAAVATVSGAEVCASNFAREACDPAAALSAAPVLIQMRQGMEKTSLLVRDKADFGGDVDEAPPEAVSTPLENREPPCTDDDFDTAAGAYHRSAHPDGPATSEGTALQQLRATVAADGLSASVAFVHEGRPHLYQLASYSVYKAGTELARGARRHYRSREAGKWATVALREDGTVVGLFEDKGRLLEVAPAGAADEAAGGRTSLLAAGAVHLARHLPVPSLLGGAAAAEANATAKGGLGLAQTSARREDDWDGTEWYPGCYMGDSDLHSFSIRFVADPSAWERHGEELQGMLEDILAQTSMIYEKQMNIRLELASVEIHKTSEGAPAYAQGCDGERFMHDKLDALAASTQPFEGAVHLFTGCGTGFGTVGVAWISSICNSRGYNTGINQIRGRSWVTFAHELGHNFGGQHSFEEGRGTTGGIMDYGDGKLDGIYQFNTNYRRQAMCALINSKVDSCQGKFVRAEVVETTPAPTTTAAPATTTTVTTTTMASTTVDIGAIQSGDSIFLRAHTGNRLTVQEDGTVQAQWDHQGSWQTLVIEKRGGGVIAAGDKIFLRAHTGMRITVTNDNQVHAHWDHQGEWQAFAIEQDGEGPIRVGDTVWLKAHTGNRLTVQDKDVHFFWDHRGSWQALVIERPVPQSTTSAPSPSTTATPSTTTTPATTTTAMPTTTSALAMTTNEGCECYRSWQYSEFPACYSWCCNPDSDPNGNWCFVKDAGCQGKNWGYCGGDGPAPTPTPATTPAPTPMPTPAPTPTPSPASGTVSEQAWQHFQLLNQLRAAGFTCPDGTEYEANSVPLVFDCRLWRAAQLHSQDMADNNYFSHSSQDGRSPWDRAREQGITANGENIAAGRSDPQGVLDQWKGSNGHCKNMMNPSRQMFAVGYGTNSASTYRHYWTQLLKSALVDTDDSCYPASA